MDSGTTFNYLPTAAFDALVVLMEGLLQGAGYDYRLLVGLVRVLGCGVRVVGLGFRVRGVVGGWC
jgi:hypothetical protein